jgi:Putative lumazine-binding
MKNFILSLVAMLLTTTISFAQEVTDLAQVEATVRKFCGAGDRQDATSLDKVLHPQFRAVVNRAFGSPELSLMDKPLYLQLMSDKKIGGDTRTVYVLQTDMGTNVATVKAIFLGKTLRFTTYIALVKLPSGEWQIVSDMPEIEKV